MLDAVTAAGLGVAIVLLLVCLRWKWKSLARKFETDREDDNADQTNQGEDDALNYVKTQPLETERPEFVYRNLIDKSEEPEDYVTVPVVNNQIFHHLCPHNNVVQSYEVEEKDSLDVHLDVLTRKLADKEGRLRLSKSKIRETQNEIENLHAIDHDVRSRYREIMDSLRSDLLTNEKDCKKLQDQIEWVSQRRAELKDEVRHGQLLYGQAAVELASNLAELQKVRVPEQKVMDKPRQHSPTSLRCRKEPILPISTPDCSLFTKNSHQMANMTTNTSHGMLME